MTIPDIHLDPAHQLAVIARGPTSVWHTRSVLPRNVDCGSIVYRFYDGTRETQRDAERAALR